MRAERYGDVYELVVAEEEEEIEKHRHWCLGLLSAGEGIEKHILHGENGQTLAMD